MKLIIGLGNPGREYQTTRHNAGFRVIDAIAHKYKGVLKRNRGTASLSAKVAIGDIEVILAKPLTFMNLSGVAVKTLIEKYGLKKSSLLVVCDDIDLAFGRLRIKPQGSSAGHKGIRSVIDALRSEEFARLRLGMGRPKRGKVSNYVLNQFTRKEKALFEDCISAACDCCESWVCEGVTKTMNIFNKWSRE
ncbi:MAG: aminoacyl-tRNA hydrolase [Candidatus Omnitrophota bacterium]|jgi:PTH1 family peptidyl-tRNA hydrolase|nr:MAG: aminoacyl-tRNA hydrolase [Candidatus Omnitrophota bacterium]